MATTLAVRLPESTYKIVRELAGDEPMHTVITQAVENFRKQRMLDQVNASFEALRADPDAWRSELQEREESGGTLSDDLEGE